jgi:major type 1 subunit fimbrin (pilin)
MKHIYFITLFPLVAFSNTYAADGTITINGQIADSSCVISGPTTNGDFAVKLPTISKANLSADGDTAGRTPFSITVSDCDGTAVSTFFDAGMNLNATTGNLDSTGTAENVQIQLLGENSNPINLAQNNVSGQDNSQWVTLKGNSATLNYAAQYYATGAVKVGDVSTQVQYSIIYQ